MDSAGRALTTALVGAGVGYTLGTGTTEQHVHLYHLLHPGYWHYLCWYPYPSYGQFLPYPHDDIEGGGVRIISVEEAHMATRGSDLMLRPIKAYWHGHGDA